MEWVYGHRLGPRAPKFMDLLLLALSFAAVLGVVVSY
jgi:hypothetical protein